MAQPPRTKAIQTEAIPGAPEWFERYLEIDNERAAQLGNALEKQLTVGENLAAFFKDVKVRAPGVVGAAELGWTNLVLASPWAYVDTNFQQPGWRYDASCNRVFCKGTMRAQAPVPNGNLIWAVGSNNALVALAPAKNILMTCFLNRVGSIGNSQGSFVGYTTGYATLDSGALLVTSDLSLDSIQWEPAIRPVSAASNASVSAGAGWPLEIKNELAVKPSAVVCVQALGSDDSLPPSSCGTPAWDMGNNGNIRIHHVPGLTAGRAYSLRFLVLA